MAGAGHSGVGCRGVQCRWSGISGRGIPDRPGFADDIVAARLLTSGPIGVNLFVPQPSAATRSALDEYRDRLTPLAQRLGAELGLPRFDDDGWDEKLDVVVSVAPEVASFTFGCRRRMCSHDCGVPASSRPSL